MEKMRMITKTIVDQTVPLLDEKDLYKSSSRLLNLGHFKELTRQVRESGPLQ